MFLLVVSSYFTSEVEYIEESVQILLTFRLHPYMFDIYQLPWGLDLIQGHLLWWVLHESELMRLAKIAWFRTHYAFGGRLRNQIMN